MNMETNTKNIESPIWQHTLEEVLSAIELRTEQSLRRVISDLMDPVSESKPDKTMTVQELCDYISWHPKPQTVYDWVKNKSIPHMKTGKHLLFQQSRIDAWIKQHDYQSIGEIQAEQATKKATR